MRAASAAAFGAPHLADRSPRARGGSGRGASCRRRQAVCGRTHDTRRAAGTVGELDTRRGGIRSTCQGSGPVAEAGLEAARLGLTCTAGTDEAKVANQRSEGADLEAGALDAHQIAERHKEGSRFSGLGRRLHSGLALNRVGDALPAAGCIFDCTVASVLEVLQMRLPHRIRNASFQLVACGCDCREGCQLKPGADGTEQFLRQLHKGGRRLIMLGRLVLALLFLLLLLLPLRRLPRHLRSTWTASSRAHIIFGTPDGDRRCCQTPLKHEGV